MILFDIRIVFYNLFILWRCFCQVLEKDKCSESENLQFMFFEKPESNLTKEKKAYAESWDQIENFINVLCKDRRAN